MFTIDVLNTLSQTAQDYRAEANESIFRNRHMNTIKDKPNMEQGLIDAFLVDFINYVGACKGIDYAMYTKDLGKKGE